MAAFGLAIAILAVGVFGREVLGNENRTRTASDNRIILESVLGTCEDDLSLIWLGPHCHPAVAQRFLGQQVKTCLKRDKMMDNPFEILKIKEMFIASHDTSIHCLLFATWFLEAASSRMLLAEDNSHGVP